MSISEYTIRNCILGYKCNASWNDMGVVRQADEASDISSVRFCNTCQKEVFQCVNDDVLVENIRLNRCVSFINNEVPLSMVPDDILRVIKLRG
jgi:hypothetical protein